MAIPSNMEFPQDFKDIFGEPPPPASSGHYDSAASPSRAKQLADTEYLQHFSTWVSKVDPNAVAISELELLAQKCQMGAPKPFQFLRNGTEEIVGIGFSETFFPYRWESLYTAENAPLQVVANYQERLIMEYGVPVPENILANILPFSVRERNQELLDKQNESKD